MEMSASMLLTSAHSYRSGTSNLQDAFAEETSREGAPGVLPARLPRYDGASPAQLRDTASASVLEDDTEVTHPHHGPPTRVDSDPPRGERVGGFAELRSCVVFSLAFLDDQINGGI